MNKRTYHLMVASLDALDLKAAQAGLTERGFEARIASDPATRSIHVNWRPSSIPADEAEAVDVAPAMDSAEQTLSLHFAELTPLLREQIITALKKDDEPVPPAIVDSDLLIATLEDDTDAAPEAVVALHWSLLAELLATAPEPARVVLYDPAWNSVIPHADARKLMNWKELLEEIELDRQLFASDDEEKKKAEALVLAEELRAAEQAHAEEILLAELTPQQQPDALRYGAVLAGLAATAALAAWFLFQRAG